MARKRTTFVIELDWQPQTDEEYRKLMHLWDALTAACAATVSDPVLSTIQPKVLGDKMRVWMQAHGYAAAMKTGDVVDNGNDTQLVAIPTN